MANSQVVHTNPDFVQTGSYAAIEVRRSMGGWFEGVFDRPQALSGGVPVGDFAVTQRAAGAGAGVDVAGGEAFVMGDYGSSASQRDGLYYCKATANLTGATQIDIATGDATNARLDLIVLEVKDNAMDGSGLNQVQVRAITGTPNATLTATSWNSTSARSEIGSIWTTAVPTLPSSAIPLAVVYVPPSDTTISNDQIMDVRPSATGIYYKYSNSTLTSTAGVGATMVTAASNPASNRMYIHLPKLDYRVGFIDFACMFAAKSVTNNFYFRTTIQGSSVTRFQNSGSAVAGSSPNNALAGTNSVLAFTQGAALPDDAGTLNIFGLTTPGAADMDLSTFQSNFMALPKFAQIGGVQGGCLSVGGELGGAGTLTVKGFMMCVRIPPVGLMDFTRGQTGGRGPTFVSIRGPA